MPLSVAHEMGQRIGSSRTTDEACMRANRHHLGLPLALAMELVERGLEVGEEILARHSPRAAGELEVVGIKGIGNDQPLPAQRQAMR